MPRDQVESISSSATGESEHPDGSELYCAVCGSGVTRLEWAIAARGRHEHVFFNPVGRVFRVLCFREASGAGDASPPSTDFTWFPGYAWRIVGCRHCRAHLGWRYQALSATAPGAAVFFGLIKEMLVAARPPKSGSGEP